MAGFEAELAHKFAPTYHSSLNERNYLAQLEPKWEDPRLALAHPPWRPYVHFSVRCLEPSSLEEVHYEINYLTIWEWDSGTAGGWGEHQWDTERTAVLAAGPGDSNNPDDYALRQAYYAAHEGVKVVPLLKSRLERWLERLLKWWRERLEKRLEERLIRSWLDNVLSLDNSCYVEYPAALYTGPRVFWSRGKHASFPSQEALEDSNAADTFEPEVIAEPEDCTLVDVGNLEHPKAEWISNPKPWGVHEVSSVHSKLKDPLWDAAGNPLRQIPTLTEAKDRIRQFQRELDMKPTGQLDKDTFEQLIARLPSPDHLLRTTREIATEADIKQLIADRGMDVLT